MTLKQHVQTLMEILDNHYETDVVCYLNHETPFQLLVATILSAQCTDDRVNIVTSELFKNYKEPIDFVNESIENIENAIRSTGFYKNKAKNIHKCSVAIVNDYNSVVPMEIEQLTALAGVGRKTANVV
ncbi:MAG: endonuclease III domain-containing protein, partial [Cellulosilyticaceae bacterium]